MAAGNAARKIMSSASDEPGAIGPLGELQRRIVVHELPPGARLREQDFATEFGVSRARIRDAFGILEERGLIERVPNKGAVVARLDPKKIGELFEVREVLEAQMVRLATEKAPPETWNRLIRLFGPSMDRTISRGDFESYAVAYDQFRRQCIVAADNDVLKNLLDSLYDRTQMLIRRLVVLPGRAEEGVKQHRAILAAMKAGRAAEAERLKRANIRSSREWFESYQKFLI